MGPDGPTKKPANNTHCICDRCKHEWDEKWAADVEGFGRMDIFGDREYIPPQKSCPNCGGKYNIRRISLWSTNCKNSPDVFV